MPALSQTPPQGMSNSEEHSPGAHRAGPSGALEDCRELLLQVLVFRCVHVLEMLQGLSYFTSCWKEQKSICGSLFLFLNIYLLIGSIES